MAALRRELPDGPIVVVDQGGFAAERLRAADLIDPQTEIVELTENLGFAAGVNAGRAVLRSQRPDVHAMAIVQDDTIVGPGWLDALVAVLEGRPTCGGVQGVVVGADGRIDNAGYALDRYGAVSAVAGGADPSSLGTRAPDLVGDRVASVDAISLVASLVRTACFDQLGGLDERYVALYDDVDLCRRASSRKWRFAVSLVARVDHERSSTLGRLGFPLDVLAERNRLWSAARNGSTRELVRSLVLSLRRLRHPPRSAHRRALTSATMGIGRRRYERWRELPPGSTSGDDRLAMRAPTGVNVVGYHHVTSGLGAVAREFSECLRAAGVAVVDIDNDLSDSPRRRDPGHAGASESVHRVTVAFVTAFEFPYFRHRFPQLGGEGHRMIGYWFWELDTIPEQHRDAFATTDEVWAATHFVRDAYRSAAPPGTFVHRAPLRLPTPEPPAAAAARWRDRFGTSFVFLVSFDYLSVPERKHPEAAVEAFRLAFGDEVPGGADDPTDVALVIKSINAVERPVHAAAIRAAAGGDPRIVFVDEHLTDDEHHGLLAAADCYVSPHRSEGLGLHVALAMWLETPVIATRYGGVVDICDDTTAWMVDYDLVGVVDGGGVYPPGAPWADIRIDRLADAMRAVHDDPAERERRVALAHRHVADQPSRAEFGHSYERLLRTPTPSPRPSR